MSVESMSIALHHSRATGTARLVLIGIANHDGDGGAWPSIATLAKYAGVNTRNTQKAIRRLQELGEVGVTWQAGGTQDTPDVLRPNRYTFLLACPGDCDRTSQHRTARQLRLIKGDRVSVATPGVGSDTPPPVGSDTGGVSIATPEPSYEPPREPAQLSASTTDARGRAVDNPPAHSCDKGWLIDAADMPAPCLVCKPHLARRWKTS